MHRHSSYGELGVQKRHTRKIEWIQAPMHFPLCICSLCHVSLLFFSIKRWSLFCYLLTLGWLCKLFGWVAYDFRDRKFPSQGLKNSLQSLLLLLHFLHSHENLPWLACWRMRSRRAEPPHPAANQPAILCADSAKMSRTTWSSCSWLHTH